MKRGKEPPPKGVVGIETVNTTVIIMDEELNRLMEIDGASVKVVTTDSDNQPRCFIRLANHLSQRKPGRQKTRGVK